VPWRIWPDWPALFLEQHDQRRKRNGLDPELVNYERQLECEEGLAKYTELEILRQTVGLPVAP